MKLLKYTQIYVCLKMFIFEIDERKVKKKMWKKIRIQFKIVLSCKIINNSVSVSDKRCRVEIGCVLLILCNQQYQGG